MRERGRKKALIIEPYKKLRCSLLKRKRKKDPGLSGESRGRNRGGKKKGGLRPAGGK